MTRNWGRPWLGQDVARVKRMRAAGAPLPEIAAAVGRTAEGVRGLLEREGVRPPAPPCERVRPDVLCRYHGGQPVAQIAAELGVSRSCVRNALRRGGVPPCDARGRYRRRLLCEGEPHLAALRDRCLRVRAAREGFPGASSAQQLDTLRLLRDRGPMTAAQLAAARGRVAPRRDSAQGRMCRALAAAGLVVRRWVRGASGVGSVAVYELSPGYPRRALPPDSGCRPNRVREPRRCRVNVG